ncbi:MAG: cation transporter [Clostridia bacterium]|nr:cation transporter [Clostridia bacterium]
MADGVKNTGMHVSVVSIIVNLILSVFKLAAGIIAHSGAMISDAVHSASDVFSTIIVMIGIKISGKDSDTGHQYGHDRMECIAAALLSIVLFATGLGVGYTSLTKIAGGNYENLAMPGALALAAAVISIIVKEWMYHYTKAAAKRENSSALMADAWHHRSDSLSSVGSFVGIFGARLGFKVLDPLAGFVICIFIIKAAVKIFRQAMDQMVDKSCDNETAQKIRDIITETPGVETVDMIKTRMFGPKIYVDVEFGTNGDMTLREAHRIAENVHNRIEDVMPSVKHCMVHVNPTDN